MRRRLLTSWSRRLRPALKCLGLVLLLAGIAWGCGRNSTTQNQCSSNGDCSSGQLCVGGVCTDADDVDGGPDIDGSIGSCEAISGGCYREVCSGAGADSGSSCSLEACEVNCEPFETLSGCGCSAASCDNQNQCGDYACVDGTCQRCEADDDCNAGQQCNDDGTCSPATSCKANSDCPPDQECNDNGECVDQPDCLVDSDCDEGESCFNGRCTRTPSCESDQDCPKGQECIGEQCFERICSSDSECAGDRVCDAGECVKPGPVAECFVATTGGQISNNQSIPLQAYALDADGNGVSTRFVWSSSNPSVAKIGSSGNAAVGGTSSGQTTVTARVAQQNVRCSGQAVFSNPGVLQSGQTRFVVTDAKTGAPIENATVKIAGGMTRQTDAAGVATIPKPSGAYTVSVFASNYNYLTIRGLQARDIRLPLLSRTGDGPVAGFTGQFDTSSLHTTGDFTIGLAGASIPGGLLQVGVTELLGQPFTTEIGQFSTEAEVPAGIIGYGQVFGGLQVDIKKKYYATTPGGARLGWGLAGRVPPGELISIVRNSTDFGETLGTLLPLFNRFDHAIKPLQLTERPRVVDSNDIDGDDNTSERVPDYNAFPNVSLKPNVRQNLVTQVSVSNFPQLDSGETNLAVFVGGHVSRSAGFVPLGISATTDENEDGFPDLRQLSLAPQHSSLSGGRYAVTALTFQPQGSGGGPGPGDVTLPDEYSAALWSRQSLPNSIGLGTFPDASSGSVNRSAREISITADAGPLYRVRLVGDNRTWEIFATGPMSSMNQYQHTVTVPQAAPTAVDLLSQSNTRVSVDSIQSTVSIDDIAKATGVGLRRIGLVATAYNRNNL